MISAFQNGLADLVAGHLKQRLFKGGIAALGDIFLDILRVAAAAVFQDDPLLPLIEGDILLPGIGHAVQMVDQTVDDLAAQNGLFQDLAAVLGLHMDIQDAHGLDMHQRAHLAEAVAAAHLHMDALFRFGIVLQAHIDGQAAGLALGLQIFIDLHGAAGDAAGAGADQDGDRAAAGLQVLFGLSLIGVEHFTGESAHACASFFRISSSSFRAASGLIWG